MTKRPTVIRVAAALGGLCCLFVSTAIPASAAGVYFVKGGDTLAGISRVFKVDVDEILKLNRLKTPDIRPGDRIRIPDHAESVVEVAPHREVSPGRMLQALCRDETVYHSVVRGDTLSSISRHYATSLQRLLELNELPDGDNLSVGQKVVVRKSSPRAHIVSRGETLTRIAARSGVDVDTIARLNQIDAGRISPGQRLQLEPCDPIATAGSAPPPLGENNRGFSASAGATAQRVIDLARTMLDVPYRFGGSTLRGIDCSAYVQRVFGLIDVQIPRTAREQYVVGARIDRDDIQIGDLVFFRTYASFASHVGIYLGENLFIHASSMLRKVTIDNLDRPFYRKRFMGARRLIGESGTTVASKP